MQPLTKAVDSAKVMMDLAEYHPLGSGLGYVDGLPYYVPRKLETRVLFYRNQWSPMRWQNLINIKNASATSLKSKMGSDFQGLYAGNDPAQWDLYDLYVSGRSGR